MQWELRILVAAGLCALSTAAPTGAQVPNNPLTPPGQTAAQFCPKFIPNPLPPATQGQPYSVELWTMLGSFQQMTGAPPGLSVVDQKLVGTPTQAGTFKIAVTVQPASACTAFSQNTGPVTVRRDLTVLDAQPPTISAFTVSPDELPYSGGDVIVTVQASDNVGVAKVLSSRALPDGTGNSGFLQRTAGSDASGTWKMIWSLPQNAAATPVSYTFKAWALDAANNNGRAASARTVVVGAHPSAQDMKRLKPTTP